MYIIIDKPLVDTTPIIHKQVTTYIPLVDITNIQLDDTSYIPLDDITPDIQIDSPTCDTIYICIF